MKGQSTEVLAGSGESAEDAENPESGKPPILSLKIQGEGRVLQEGELEPSRQEGCWARRYNLGRGKHHPRFYRVRLQQGEHWKKHPSFSLPSSLIPYLCLLSAGQTRSQLEGVSFQGQEQEERKWLQGGAGGRGRGGKNTRKLNYVTVPGV